MRQRLSGFAAVCLCIGGLFAFRLSVSALYSGTQNSPETPTLAMLLGDAGKEQLVKRAGELNIDGKSYSWKEYSDWGKELFFHGSVKAPPTGPKPSKLLSDFYTCSSCHNHRREDRALPVQDPESRVAWITDQNKKTSEGGAMWLAPGTTLWGAVNRETFYNESYELYHDLNTVGEKPMNATKIEDATQICCRYCSVGRFAQPWEIIALLAYLWELEVKGSDLDLPKSIEKTVLEFSRNAKDQDPKEVLRMREFLRRQYLRKAGETVTPPPTKYVKASVGPYPDKLIFDGDAKNGELLYKMACVNCHGKDKANEIEGAALVRDLKKFHSVLSIGTERDDQPYMPRFTSQRLSRQQIADIQAFLSRD